jgi:hypothetical protein
MIALLPRDGRTIDLMEWWHRFTLDASAEYLFGESVESLLNPKVSPLHRVLRLDILRRGILNDSKNSIAEISDGPVLAILLSKGVYSIYEDLESIHRAFCRTCSVTM